MYILIVVLVLVVILIIGGAAQAKNSPSISNNDSGEALNHLLSDNQVEVSVRQLLESTWIMANSKVLNTVYSRFNLCLAASSRIEAQMNNSLYGLMLQRGMNAYFETYPDRVLMAYQQKIIDNPTPSTLNDFYCSAILLAVCNYVEKEAAEISDLKQKKAIERRKDILRSNLNGSIYELNQWCKGCEKYDAAITLINKMLATISAGGPMVLSDAPGQVFLNE